MIAAYFPFNPQPEEGYPQTKAKKRRSSTKPFGEPTYKRSASNGDSDGIKTENGETFLHLCSILLVIQEFIIIICKFIYYMKFTNLQYLGEVAKIF